MAWPESWTADLSRRAVRPRRLTLKAVAAEPSLRDASATPALVVKLVLAGLLSLGVVTIVPRTVSSSSSVPPVGMLLTTATIVAAICGVLLFWGLRSDLGLPATVAVYAVVFNVLVIGVKLVLGPRGYYEVNQTKDLDSTFAISDSFMAVFAGRLRLRALRRVRT